MGNASRRRATAQRHRQIQSKALTGFSEGTPRFVADVMLGRLSKWLRIAGFDVLYSNRFTDDELLALSRQEDRILLSRDTRLLIRKSVERFIFLESEKIHDQIRQVFKATHTVRLPALLTRCLACNARLVNASREQVRERVPPYVYQTHLHFRWCPLCRKVFWAGTHRQAVIRTLETLLPR